MFKYPKISEVLSFIVPMATDAGALARQGLKRLLLLRSLVTLGSVSGLFIFQPFLNLDVSPSLIAVLILAVLISVVLGYRRLKSSGAVSNIE